MAAPTDPNRSDEKEVELTLEEEGEGPARALGRRLGRPDDTFSIVRRSLDARKIGGRSPRFRYVVRLVAPQEAPPQLPWANDSKALGEARRVVVVGSGPAGMFAALRLVAAGLRPIIVERGKPVQPRRRDLARLTRGDLDADSNYCFGEGGAGTYSDGKLYTRTKDRAATQQVLEVLVHFGAPASILYDSRPHIGSNRLPKLVAAMRQHLEGEGVEYVWADPVVDFMGPRPAQSNDLPSAATAVLPSRTSPSPSPIAGVVLRSGRRIEADAIILATGHSARDMYALCASAGVAVEPKPFAVGVRVEHPQPLIDGLQYGRAAGHPVLPAAFYHVTANHGGRGIYAFCMCPGGWIVPSSTEPELLCTNGMSLSRRDSPFANAALVVTVTPADFAAGPLGGMAFQRDLERRAYAAGGGDFIAPGQRVDDFVAGRPSTKLPRTSYRPGVVATDFRDVLPAALRQPLTRAIVEWGRKMPGFITAEAQLVGVETRTSAPVRIVRDAETLASPTHPSLFPCAEGAGYAGGIVSAAIDGIRVAERILQSR